MGIGRALADKKGGDFCEELPKETNTKAKLRKNRRHHHHRHRKTTVPPVQKLFETCQQVFATGGPGTIPSLQHIETLRSVLDGIIPEDVGLKPEMPYFSKHAAGRTPKITYLHIYECEKFSMGIFCLPPSGVIPLHNHPAMTVFSKLLFLTMHIKYYDWIVDLPPGTPSIFKPSESEKLICIFRLCQPGLWRCGWQKLRLMLICCAVLDVLGPPYSDPDGRHCTYYLNSPFSKFSVDGISITEEEGTSYEWLQEKEKPENLQVVGQMYSGPNIVEF